MNKTAMFLGVLAVGFANAQQQGNAPYEGKVGINTKQPKGTLDIQPNAENARVEATTNEGLIAPRLSKTRIANITNPIEGTLVYATDETTSPISAYVGNNNKVAKITEKGYYFYNGAEWVKAGSEKNNEIWQKQANKDIVLVDNDIENTIKYTEKGGYWNIPKTLRPSSRFEANNSSVITEPFNLFSRKLGQSKVLNIDYADKILDLSPNSNEKQLVANDFRIDQDSNSSRINRYTTLFNTLNTELNSSRDFQLLYASINNVNHYGTGKVSLLASVYNNAGLYNGSADRIIGAYNQSASYVSSNLDRLEGTYSVVFPKGTGKVVYLDVARNHIRLDTTKGDITHASTSKNEVFIPKSFSNTIDNLMGTHTSFAGIHSDHTGTIKNMYGLKIENVNKGTTTNRAIHTEAGEIRFGDLAGTGDRVVVANANGVLKTSKFIVRATDTSESCGNENVGAIHYKEINQGGKMVGVFGFCTRGADGNPKWFYRVAGGNAFDGTGAFGSGL